MKKINYTIFGLLIIMNLSAWQNQESPRLQQSNGELNISFNDLEAIKLNSTIQLKDLFKVDADFKILSSLGEPSRKDYKDHIGYETWRYEYKDLYLDFINQNGYITIQSISFKPTQKSEFKIVDKDFRSETNLKELASFESGLLVNNNGNVAVNVVSDLHSKVDPIKFIISLDRTHKTVKEIRIDFDDF